MTAHDRLLELQTERDDRLYNEAVSAAGFDDSDDYDTWLVLEELRKLTLSERKAAADKENPPKTSGTSFTINSGVIGFDGPSPWTSHVRGPQGV
jgi:hypothetical protein